MSRVDASRPVLSIGDLMLAVALIASALTPLGWMAWMIVTYFLFPCVWCMEQTVKGPSRRRDSTSDRLGRAVMLALLLVVFALIFFMWPRAWFILRNRWASTFAMAVIALPCVLVAAWAIAIRIETRTQTPHGPRSASQPSQGDPA